ncbi:MAG TPA: coenzyme F420-0:L-glutamate ligase, partial [Terriglobales bacterium]|nr:coenzyme F420-0:L-glutamate ligase [Terriglobales bacterium]
MTIQIIPIRKIPLIKEGDNVADFIVRASKDEEIQFKTGDVVVIAQKIVSKAEGRAVKLDTITPSRRAEEIAKTSGKDPRHVEAILRESAKIVRQKDAHLIVETRH